MKKYMPGFVPVNYNIAGKLMIPLGSICVLAKLIAYITNLFEFPTQLLYAGIALIIIGWYLIFVVPNPNKN